MKRTWFWLLAGLGVGLVTFWAAGPAAALPEYTTRTGETCSACHINPAGGGPRTLPGLIWVAKGKPDQIPEIPLLIKPGPPQVVGKQLYKQLCAGCHGSAGQGVWAASLTAEPLKDFRVRDRTSSGVGLMPGFGKRLTAEQLDAVTEFVMRLNKGVAAPPEQTAPLPPAKLGCVTPTEATESRRAAIDRCGGN